MIRFVGVRSVLIRLPPVSQTGVLPSELQTPCVTPTGFEPVLPSLKVMCIIQFCYEVILWVYSGSRIHMYKIHSFALYQLSYIHSGK